MGIGSRSSNSTARVSFLRRPPGSIASQSFIWMTNIGGKGSRSSVALWRQPTPEQCGQRSFASSKSSHPKNEPIASCKAGFRFDGIARERPRCHSIVLVSDLHRRQCVTASARTPKACQNGVVNSTPPLKPPPLKDIARACSTSSHAVASEAKASCTSC